MEIINSFYKHAILNNESFLSYFIKLIWFSFLHAPPIEKINICIDISGVIEKYPRKFLLNYWEINLIKLKQCQPLFGDCKVWEPFNWVKKMDSSSGIHFPYFKMYFSIYIIFAKILKMVQYYKYIKHPFGNFFFFFLRFDLYHFFLILYPLSVSIRHELS